MSQKKQGPRDSAPTTTSLPVVGGADEYRRLARADWWELVADRDEAGRRAHADNVAACKAAVSRYLAEQEKGDSGKVRVLALYASGRSSERSRACRPSNSRRLLSAGLDAVRDDRLVEVTELALRDLAVSPCEGCYSTASGFCGFPCDALPLDDMHRIYPLVLESDVVLVACGTQQAAMPGRLKNVIDRLISLDGGFFVDADQWAFKDGARADSLVKMSREAKVPYDQRMHNKVAAFFVTNKDDVDTGYLDDNGVEVKSYVGAVADSLYRGFYNWGFAFPLPYFVAFRANPAEDLSFDRERLDADAAVLAAAASLARAAVARAREVRRTPLPPVRNPPGRT